MNGMDDPPQVVHGAPWVCEIKLRLPSWLQELLSVIGRSPVGGWVAGSSHQAGTRIIV